MNKADLASYLVSLHSLIEAQTKGQRSIATKALADEYERTWEQLKQEIENEAGKRKEYDERAEGGAKVTRHQPGTSIHDRGRTDSRYADEANDLRAGFEGPDGRTD